MARAGSSFFTVTDRPPPPGVGPETGPTIIWLRGEQDIATDADLRRTLACAISLNNAAIVVDLSKVELMSVSTLGVIVAAWNDLRQQSRSLTMRAPHPTSGASSASAAYTTFSARRNATEWRAYRERASDRG